MDNLELSRSSLSLIIGSSGPRWLTIAEAAEVAGETEDRIRAEIKAGRLRAERVTQKTTRVKPSAVTRWIKDGRGRERIGVGELFELPAVYRIYGRADKLLYVGSTGNLGARMNGHSKQSPWWPKARYITIERFATRFDAYKAEGEVIRAEKPTHNVTNVYWGSRLDRTS
jgi:excisionase family DNA binding protein